MDGPTAIQQAVLTAIERRKADGLSPPTYRELCEEFGWASTATARDHLKALNRKGLLDLPGRSHRGVRSKRSQSEAIGVAVLGRVSAGKPVPSQEDLLGYIAVPKTWLGRGEHFALQVSGLSMIDAGIFDGDCVVVRRQSSAEPGDIVVATLAAETTLKRFERKAGRIILKSENSSMASIEPKTDDFQIHGVVVGLSRAYGARGVATSQYMGR